MLTQIQFFYFILFNHLFITLIPILCNVVLKSEEVLWTITHVIRKINYPFTLADHF